MKIGKAWLVIEKDENIGYSKLLSIMPPRLALKYVKLFVEQMFVDRFGDLNERIMHKKRNSNILKAQADGSVVTLKVSGESKYVVAYCAVNSRIERGMIYFTFHKAIPHKNECYNIIESVELEAYI